MDSLTQATLGAAVAHAVWHRPLGCKALWWGAGLGTLPDLDIVIYPWLDQVQRLYWHRGESHSLWVLPIFVWLAVWLLRRVHPSAGLSRRRAMVGAALIFVTHVAIDVFTVYGTQLLAPISRHGYGTHNLFIIDPLFTGPLLLGVLTAARWAGGRGARFNTAGLILSTLYVGWSFSAQAVAARVFRAELVRQGIVVECGFTSATAFNTVLWRHLAQVEGGLLVGYWSLRDADRTVRFDFVPRQAELVAPWRETRAFRAVDWFAQGYWVADRPAGGAVRLSDLRFGEIRPGPDTPPEEWGRIFVWELRGPPGQEADLLPQPQDFGGRRAALGAVWRRLNGDRSGW
jgi:inner membrane protein